MCFRRVEPCPFDFDKPTATNVADVSKLPYPTLSGLYQQRGAFLFTVPARHIITASRRTIYLWNESAQQNIYFASGLLTRRTSPAGLNSRSSTGVDNSQSVKITLKIKDF